MRERVVVAMSGGVDSSVAAYLLKEQGYDVIGVTIKTWSSDECRDERSKGCCSIRDIDDARSVARRLDIPYYVMDLSPDFKESVIDYFVDEYLAGRTPNPCIECNRTIKFGVLLDKADALGARSIATGHYARVDFDAKAGRHYIYRGRDAGKDQSYVLFGLSQAQLSRTLLPIGELDKSRVREIAAAIGLRVSEKPDSQEICFVKGRYEDFVSTYAPERIPGGGDMLDASAAVVARHAGAHAFTVGQRRRIRVTDRTAYFVTRIDAGSNTVTIGKEAELYAAGATVRRMNWMLPVSAGCAISVKIRSRHEPTPARIVSLEGDSAKIRFDVAQKAVTPGQAAVLYDGERVLGGGWIERAHNEQADVAQW